MTRLVDPARALALYEGGFTTRMIAERFNVNPPAITRAIRQAKGMAPYPSDQNRCRRDRQRAVVDAAHEVVETWRDGTNDPTIFERLADALAALGNAP